MLTLIKEEIKNKEKLIKWMSGLPEVSIHILTERYGYTTSFAKSLIELFLNNTEEYDGYLHLPFDSVSSFGILKYVGGNLNLYKSSMKTIDSITHVKGWVNLNNSKISYLGTLKYVGDNIYLHKCPLDKFKEKQIRQMVKVNGVVAFG
jgi:hypothetical protein